MLWLATSASASNILDYKSGILSNSNSTPIPTRSVVQTTDGCEITYTFDGAELEESCKHKNAYSWKIAGFSPILEAGMPAYLTRRDRIQIPKGFKAEMQLLDAEYKTFEYELKPSDGIIYDNLDRSLDQVSDYIYPYNGYLPESSVTNIRNNKYRGTDILEIGIYPIQYNYYEKKVKVATKLSYKVTFTADNSSRKSSSTNIQESSFDDPFLANICINSNLDNSAEAKPRGLIISPSTPSMVSETYLIITSSRYLSAAQKLADWKKLLGYNVIIKSKSAWKSTDVFTAVDESGMSVRYLLIIGDYEDVPGVQFDGYFSDRPYAFFSGNDGTEADILYGRISVSSSSEANGVIDKIITYEKNPPSTLSFYNTGINCADFVDNGEFNEALDGKEDRRFSQTMYEIYEYLKRNSYQNIVNHFHTNDNVNPEKWFEPKLTDVTSSTGIKTDLIENSMRKPNYLWNSTGSKVSTQLNIGAFYLMHRGHGSYNGWQYPNLTANSVASLTNGEKLPVVFSINCETGSYAGKLCFAERFLRNLKGGAVAVFASSTSTNTFANDVYAQAIINSIWPSPGMETVFGHCNIKFNSPFESMSKTPVYRLGQIHQQASAVVGESFDSNYIVDCVAYSYHCFGDPSMYMRTRMPIKSSGDVSVDGNFIVVSTDSFSQISVYNPNTDTSCVIVGNEARLPLSEYSDATFTFYGPNRIPVSITLNDIKKVKAKEISNKTVREDRVWEYASLERKWEDDELVYNNAVLINLRFFGTSEINGKTYNNCYIYPASEKFDIEKAVLYSYVREENGKIYSYFPESLEDPNIKMDYHKYQILKNNKYDTELLAYDFNLNENESYHPFDDNNMFIHSVSEESAYGRSNGHWWIVSQVSETNVADATAKQQEVVSGYNPDIFLFTTVEGVGRISGFCNFMPMPIWQSSYAPCDCELSYSHFMRKIVFNNLYDDNGNVIFRGENIREGESFLPTFDAINEIQEEGNPIIISENSLKVAQPSEINIYSLQGAFVDRFNALGGDIISLSHLAPGVYIVKYTSAQSDGVLKMVVR